ncbi:ScbR family autoregulator-binding transcription factor [Streptomyces sp. NPDC058052]|uniref:ScbR family autoregulator-binding transcription factor n=1 Tax=Streptomyces sp. NPDC058052 TaxID=3346316 RepID=UPI0036E10A0D
MRQERALRTRRAILEAASSIFEKRGFAAAPLSEIIAVSGVTKGALYFHFSSKEELARGVIEEQFSALERLRSQGSPLQQAIDSTHAAAHALKHFPLVRAGIRLVIEQGSFTEPDPEPYLRWVKPAQTFLEQAREERELRPEVDVPAVAQLIVALFMGAQMMAQAVTQGEDLGERITAFWRVALPGLAVPEVLHDLKPEGLVRFPDGPEAPGPAG